MLFEHTELYDVVNETYYGKNNNLKKCEKLFDDIIYDLRDAHKSSFTNDRKVYDINNDPRKDEIERLLEDTFNLDSFDLTFYVRQNYAYNAWTIPTTIPIFNKDKSKKYGINSSGYKLNCHVDSVMLTLSDMTGGEILAIILHEIGHNFDASIFYILSNLTFDIKQDLMGLLLSITPIKRWIGKIQTYIDKFSTILFSEFPRIKKVYFTYLNCMMSFKKYVNSFKIVPQIIKNPYYLLRALSPHNIFGYGNEKFADSFAAAHGYGKELISALEKLERGNGLIIGDATKECGLIAIPYDLTRLFIDIALAPIDPHPASPIRLKSVISKLKRDLKDPNLDPKLKKELIQQIEYIEKYIEEEYTNIYTDENKNRCIRVLYCKLLYNFPIDVRELGELIKPREI